MSRLLTDDVDNLKERLAIDDYLWLMKSPDFARVIRFLQAQDAMTLKAVGKDYYCVPRWCRLFPLEHFDGAGGCWGISCGHVVGQGEYYCETCEYYRGEMPRG